MGIRDLTRGAVAGAAGVTALNLTTYLDMAVRGRSASSAPATTAERLLDRCGITVPGDDQTRQNRLEAIGALLGIATGVGVGIAHAAVRGRATGAASFLAAILATGAVAMAAADVPMTALGVTDPRSWSTTDWLSDVVPHVVYGAATTAVVAGGR